MIDFDKYSTLSNTWSISGSAKAIDKLVAEYSKKYQQAIDELNDLRESRSFSPYMRDRRTPEKYIEDLVEAWLVEDIILQSWLPARLKDLFSEGDFKNMKINNSGADSDRKVQFTAKSIRAKVTTEPDFQIILPDTTKSIEFQFSRKSLPAYDMKENKVNRSDGDSGLVFLWYIQADDEFFFVDPKWLKSSRQPQVNFLWGGKMTYKMKTDEVKHYKMSQNFDDSIKKVLLAN